MRFSRFRHQEADPLLKSAIQYLGSGHLRTWLATLVPVDYGSRITVSFYKDIASAVASLRILFSWEYSLAANPPSTRLG